MKCENVAHRTVDGRRDTCRLCQFDDSAAEPSNFQPVPTLQIVVHRRGNLRRETVAESEAVLSVFRAEGDALRTADGDHLAHGIQKEEACPGCVRIGPIGKRMVVVVADRPTKKTNFSQIALRMS